MGHAIPKPISRRAGQRHSRTHTDARNAVGAIALVSDIDWPPRAVTIRVLDTEGREVHSEVKGDRPRVP